MNDVIRAVEKLMMLPGAHIDCGFRQGRDAVFAQTQKLGIGKKEENMLAAEQLILHTPQYIADLYAQVVPYQPPDDYIFFLEFYGGGWVETTDYNLLINGIGPMVEEWYSFIFGDDAEYENGLLLIGTLLWWEGDYIKFYLDLAGHVDQYCVIGISLGGAEDLNSVQVLQNLHQNPGLWKKVGDSFTGWLEQAAETHGTFGYV
jgi:hypothetical protein